MPLYMSQKLTQSYIYNSKTIPLKLCRVLHIISYFEEFTYTASSDQVGPFLVKLMKNIWSLNPLVKKVTGM